MKLIHLVPLAAALISTSLAATITVTATVYETAWETVHSSSATILAPTTSFATPPGTTTEPATSTSYTQDPSFTSAILAEHNVKRALNQAPALVWDDALAQYAANYAESTFSCDNVQLVHSGGPYGENLAAGYVGGASPVDAWYGEYVNFDFTDPAFSESTGHFSQVVWVSTTSLGCYEIKCDNEWRQYTICEYYPRGNVIGTLPDGNTYFEENVLPAA